MTSVAPSEPYLCRADGGEALWFVGCLATVKAGRAQTRGRMAVIELLHPPGFAPPLHRHLEDDEAFYLLSGTAEFRSEDKAFSAGPGDFVWLPVSRPHTFVAGPEEPLRVLQITTPAGFEEFAADAGVPARARRLPEPGPVDPVALAQTAARHNLEILGPPPTA